MNVFRHVVNEIVRSEQSGQTFVREELPEELRWVWKEINTQRKLTIRVSDAKTALNEMMPGIVVNFVQGKTTAKETKQLIERWDRLSAFH